jgi:cytochrome c-type biogenesis protein CcmH
LFYHAAPSKTQLTGNTVKKISLIFAAVLAWTSLSALAAPISVSGHLSLSPQFKSRVSPNDTLYIIARAVNGPRMPLAVFRAKADILPFVYVLNDSMAMSPEMKLSDFDQVVVVARISRSGDPMPHPGDLEVFSRVVRPGTTGIDLTIDKLVK